MSSREVAYEPAAGSVTQGTMPRQIGPYRIISVLGQGGMGTVYLAEQEEPARREVALKVVKFGMEQDWILARFETERRALACMNHPNIATVYEAGTTEDGTPYLAMERVKGEPITAYCDNHRLKTQQRLALFNKVCEAISHAHRKMVIHRDLKPSNVLIMELDGRPEPKVIDFGIARDTRQEIALTKAGNPIGTPMYMSPEQIEGNLEDVDARVDVYVLGVLLYELLTGALPYESSKGADHRLMVRIMEEDPPSPSTRLTSLGATRTEIALKRGTSQKVLRSQLRGDLDWIVMKAMEKNRERRYGSVDAFREDIERFLHDQPVSARPPSLADRCRKFVRRNRLAVITGGLILLSLVAGITATTLAMLRADRARSEAQHEERRANLTVSYLQQILGSADPQLEGRNVTLVSVLAKASKSLGEDLSGQPLVEASVRHTIGWTYLELGLYEEAQAQLDMAVTLRTANLGERNSETLSSINALGRLYYKRGRYLQAEDVQRRVFQLQSEVLGPENEGTLWTMYNLAKAEDKQGDFQPAEELYRRIIGIRRKLAGPDSVQELVVINSLSLLLSNRGNPAEAERLQRENLHKLIAKLGEDHPNTLIAQANLVEILNQRGLFQQALDLGIATRSRQIRILGADHPETLGCDSQIALAMVHLGQMQGGEAALRRCLEAQTRVLGADHPDTVRTYANLAAFYEMTQRYAEAEIAFGACAEAAAQFLAGDNWQIAYYKGMQGRCLFKQGRLDQGKALLLQSLTVLEHSAREERNPILDALSDLYLAEDNESEARRLRSLKY